MTNAPTMDSTGREGAELEMGAFFPFLFFADGESEDSDFVFLYSVSLLASNLIKPQPKEV